VQTASLPRDLLHDFCRQLADFVSWDRSAGDDTPRFGLLFRSKADDLVVAAGRLAAHSALSSDVELKHRVAALRGVAERTETDPTFNRDVIASGHEVAERGEDLLDVAW
jgi:hypothetical protein